MSWIACRAIVEHCSISGENIKVLTETSKPVTDNDEQQLSDLKYLF